MEYQPKVVLCRLHMAGKTIQQIREECAGQDRLNQQLEKLASLQAEEEALRWDMEVQQGKPPTKQQQKRLESLQREIAALQDTTGDRARELEKAAYNTATRTVIQASAFDRAMKLEAELNKIHGRIIKLLTSEQIERVNLILSGIPGGAQKAFSSVIRRANSTVKAETVRQITGTYAISAQRVRAGGNIRAQVKKADGGVVGTVTFAGYKLPLGCELPCSDLLEQG